MKKLPSKITFLVYFLTTIERYTTLHQIIPYIHVSAMLNQSLKCRFSRFSRIKTFDHYKIKNAKNIKTKKRVFYKNNKKDKYKKRFTSMLKPVLHVRASVC